jgi:hypothetical protein
MLVQYSIHGIHTLYNNVESATNKLVLVSCIMVCVYVEGTVYVYSSSSVLTILQYSRTDG